MKKSKVEAKKPVKKSICKKFRNGMKVLGLLLAAGVAVVAASERKCKEEECGEPEQNEEEQEAESEYFYNK